MQRPRIIGNRKKWQVIGIVIGLSFLIHTSIAHAQEADKATKFRLAQGFEEAGEWEHAVALFEELYTSDPTNYLYLDCLQRGYTQIKEYDKAINVIRRWFTIQPKDVNLMATLGGLYYDLGREASADSVWNAIIAIDPTNVQLYRLVAHEMMEHRLYDQCIRMYSAGRSVSKNGTLFADELGSLYIALQQYTLAGQEYTQLVKSSPDQLSFVQSRLSAFTSKPEALQAASKAVSTEITSSPNNIALRRLYAWLLMEDRRYDVALEQYRMIDKLSSANGNELFNFAQRLSQEHAYQTASEAFKEVIDRYTNPRIVPFARFGYARAMEELSVATDVATLVGDSSTINLKPETLPNFTTVFRLYESIVNENLNPDLTAQSLFRIGIIKYEKLFDLDGALDALNRIKLLPQVSNISYDATLNTGIIYEARNDLSEARKTFNTLTTVSLTAYQDQAIFKLAELDYFEAQFDSSLSKLKRFNANLNTDLANDALQLQYFIQENKTSAPQALAEFAKADLLIQQRKYSESLVQFQDIVRRYNTTLILDDAMMKIGDLYLRLKQTNEALAAFHFVVDSIRLSIFQDYAQFRIGEVYQNILKNKTAALEAYEKLLAQFPNSLYAEETRRRIRILRGDTF